MNFLLVQISHMGWDSVYPNVPTSNLYARTQSGTWLSNFSCQPVGLLSAAPARLGRFVHRFLGKPLALASHWSGNPNLTLPASAGPAVPMVFKLHGYKTGLFGKWAMGDAWGTSPRQRVAQLYGFDVWKAGLPQNVDDSTGTGYSDWLRVHETLEVEVSENTYCSELICNEFASWWGSNPQPKFAEVRFGMSHAPWHVPPANRMDPSYVPDGVTDRGKHEAMCMAVDYAFGELMSHVDLEDTYVLVAGDCGTTDSPEILPTTWDKAKRTTFKAVEHVPCFAVGPTIPCDQTSNELMSCADISPTLLDWAGILNPASWTDGTSARLLFENGQAVRPFSYSAIHRQGILERTVQTKEYKLREYDDFQDLFDLVADPEEENPIDPDTHPDTLLVSMMRSWLADPSV